jgi:hypothetical protein
VRCEQIGGHAARLLPIGHGIEGKRYIMSTPIEWATMSFTHPVTITRATATRYSVTNNTPPCNNRWDFGTRHQGYSGCGDAEEWSKDHAGKQEALARPSRVRNPKPPLAETLPDNSNGVRVQETPPKAIRCLLPSRSLLPSRIQDQPQQRLGYHLCGEPPPCHLRRQPLRRNGTVRMASEASCVRAGEPAW